ncbi:hypothetical protein OBV_18160 [Oscillibacter valericigenes Sjm18-20]|nr:hypothetical protein OBV_18160 [Oscillibacter valericigenes Sjm18-20]
MAELKFETGIVTFSINGVCDISFNPTDSAFVEKLFNAFDTLDKRQEAYKAEIEKTANKREVFGTARKMDAEMREIIDGVFDRPVCADIFGGMNVYALADGLPVWCNFMMAIIDETDTTFAREQKATNPRIAKYTKKYHK